jgi:hypothetical protein
LRSLGHISPVRTNSCTHLPQHTVPRITCVLQPTHTLCLYTLLHLFFERLFSF